MAKILNALAVGTIYPRFQLAFEKLLRTFLCKFGKFVPTMYDEPALHVLTG